MDFETRTQLTRELISLVRIPTPPPPGFNPLRADHETLIKHGLPLPPDQSNYPHEYKKWAHLMSHALTFVPPELGIIEDVAPTDLSGDPPSEGSGGHQEGHKSHRWAGAVNTNTNSDSDPYQKVEGSWIIPRAYPLTADWTNYGWKNRSLRSGTWVGIDGYHTKDSHVVQSGTGVRCIVSPRQTIVHETHAWVEWIPAGPISFENFEVNSGDLVTCIVESPDPDRSKSTAANKSARIMFFNRSTCNYSTAHLVMPRDGKPVQGKTAEWIVEGPDPSKKEIHPHHEQPWNDRRWHTPYLGATFIYDCVATKKSGKIENLKNAKMVDQEQYDEELKIQVVNNAVKENDGMVGVFSAPTYPVWTHIDNIPF